LTLLFIMCKFSGAHKGIRSILPAIEIEIKLKHYLTLSFIHGIFQ